HGAHADVVAELFQLGFERGNPGVGGARAHRAQARRLLAQDHRDVLGAAEPDADDGRLTGKPAPAEGDERVEIETLDALDAVTREQHAVVGAEQAALVHGGEVDPAGVRVEGVLDLRRPDAAVVVVVRAPQRVHVVGPQRYVARGVGGGAPERGFEGDRSALDGRLVADLDVPAGHTRVAAHGATVLLGRLVVLQHGLDDEGGKITLFGIRTYAQAAEIILRYLDGGFRHQLLGGLLQGCDGDHERELRVRLGVMRISGVAPRAGSGRAGMGLPHRHRHALNGIAAEAAGIPRRVQGLGGTAGIGG